MTREKMDGYIFPKKKQLSFGSKVLSTNFKQRSLF
jgi:hypothetical protein